jgi:hypothetical protein
MVRHLVVIIGMPAWGIVSALHGIQALGPGWPVYWFPVLAGTILYFAGDR